MGQNRAQKEAKRKKKKANKQKVASKMTALEMPIQECIINGDWEDEKNLSQIVVIRRRPDGNVMMAMFLVDRLCLGVKNAMYRLNMSYPQYLEFKDGLTGRGRSFIKCDYSLACKVVIEGINYAECIGFAPHSDFARASKVIPDRDKQAKLCEVEITFGGTDGKPIYISGPRDNSDKILAVLADNVGEGNFNSVLGDGELF